MIQIMSDMFLLNSSKTSIFFVFRFVNYVLHYNKTGQGDFLYMYGDSPYMQILCINMQIILTGSWR